MRKLKLAPVLALGVLLSVAFVTAGCGGGGSSSSSGSTGSAGSQAGGILTMAFGSEPPSLDPGLATDTSSAFVVSNTNTPIVTLGPAPDLKPQPALAKSWTVSGPNVTLHLRNDVKWTNGRTVTANDVVYSWLRTISPQLGADYAYQFYGIKGAQEYNSCKPSASNQQCNSLKSKVAITAPDATTVKITLTSPQPWFMQQLSHTSFIPVNKEAVTKWGVKWTQPGHDISDGPFTMTSWKHDASLTMVKNPNYWNAKAVKLNKVVLKIITDGSTAEQAFNTGEVQVNETGWPPSDTPRIKSTPAYTQFSSLGVYYYGFNVKNITDVNQRRAMALAIDRTAIVQHITQEGQVPALQLTPAGMPGASVINKDKFLKPTADIALAKTYMSKVKNPVKNITLVFNNAPGHKEIATAVQANWKELGLNVTLKQQDWPQFLKFLGPPPDPSVDVYRNGWIADFPDDINFLSIFQCGSGNNNTNWCSKPYDNVLKQATAEPNQAKRYALYQKAEAMLTGKNGQMPIAPIYWYTFVYQVAQNVHGWNTNPMDVIDLTKVSVS
ncbi:MAG TPA: peptide ABC transporter substrate-binding protein [Gaiellaceae bacterium]